MVEHQFSKLITRVRFPPSAPNTTCFNTASFNTALHAHVAQSVEHFLGKEEVTGSIPVMSTSSSHCGCLPAAFHPFIDSIGV